MTIQPRRRKQRALLRRARAFLANLPHISGRARIALACLVLTLIGLHGFWPKKFLVDGYTLGLVGVLLLLALLPLLKSANVAGVGGVEFREELEAGEESAQLVEEKREQEEESGEVEQPDRHPRIAEAHALFAVPEYLRALASRDPNVALAGLRIQLEQALRLADKVLRGSEEAGNGGRRRTVALTRIVRELREEEYLSADQAELAESIIRVGNRAAHGEIVSPDEAELVFEWAETLNRSFPVGYSLNFAPNLDFEDQGLVCEYEHCIENMPLREERTDESCPVFGHDCPGGSRRVATCPAAQAWKAGYSPFPPERLASADDSETNS